MQPLVVKEIVCELFFFKLIGPNQMPSHHSATFSYSVPSSARDAYTETASGFIAAN